MDDERYLIAILDEEETEREAFLTYFEGQFDCIELPTMSNIDELVDIIRSEKIDAIAIDYKLMDHNSSFKYNGDYFFKSLQEALLDYPAFILTSDPNHAKQESSKINPFFILDKGGMDLTNSQLRMDVFTIIQNHKNQIKHDLSELKILEEIRAADGLSSIQEDDYVELNNKIAKTVNGKSSIPRSFYSVETNSKLDDVINKAEEILKNLSEK